VMLSSFSAHLDRSLAGVPLSTEQREEIKSNSVQLAALEIPPGLDRNTSNEIKTSINQAFVSGFRLVMLICAGLSVLGAAQSWWLIPAHPDLRRQPL
jgi:hypothetical protein